MLVTAILPFLLPLAFSLPTPENEAESIEPGSFSMKDISFSGSACPQGSNSASLSGNWAASTLNFKQFAASAPDDGRTENCGMHVQGSSVTPGWQVALAEASGSGSVNLKAGSTLSSYVTSFWSQDAANTATAQATVAAPSDRTVEQDFTVTAKPSKLVWSPCAGSNGYLGILNVNVRLAIAGSKGGSFDLNKENLKWVWRKC